MTTETKVASPQTTALNKKSKVPCRRPKSIQLLGCRVDRLTRADALTWIKCLVEDGRPHQVVTANPLMLLAADHDPELKQVIQESDLVVPESSGIAWGSQQVGTPLDEFVPGIDLLEGMCRLARDLNKTIYLLGAQPGVAEKAAVTLCSMYPGLRVAGTRHGYFEAGEETGVVAHVRETAPGFLFVGFSVPNQEKWISRNLQALGVPVVMGVGGSFDVLSGRLRRAPVWMRELGIEWLFRTLQEPWRLKRIVHLPVFVWKILFSK